MPRNPAPQHYIAYKVTQASQKKITFSNGAVISGDLSDVVGSIKGRSLAAVTVYDDHIELMFSGSLPVDVQNMKIADPNYPEKEYPYPYTFDPETPPEPDAE